MSASHANKRLTPRKGGRVILAEWGRREFGFLFILALLAGSIWLFIELANAVGGGKAGNFDRTIMLALRDSVHRNNPLGPQWFQEFCRDITALGSVGVLLLVTALVSGFLMLRKKTHTAVLILAAALGALLVSSLLKKGIDRPRPDLVPHGQMVFNRSFPSGHAMLSAAVYLTWAALLAQAYPGRFIRVYLLACATLLTGAIGISRIYLGVHWPTDVLAGWTGGALWAMLCWTIADWLQQRGAMEKSPPSDSEKPAKTEDSPSPLSS